LVPVAVRASPRDFDAMEATMYRISAPYTVAFAVIGTFSIGIINSASARSLRLEALPYAGVSETTGSSVETFGSLAKPSDVVSDLVRPNYGSRECTSDQGHDYDWPCSRPGFNH